MSVTGLVEKNPPPHDAEAGTWADDVPAPKHIDHAGGVPAPPAAVSDSVPVLAHCFDVGVPVLAHDLAEIVPEILTALKDVPVLAQDRSGWRIERFGPPGADGKGRYWQWRTGRGKNRRSAYGGKVS